MEMSKWTRWYARHPENKENKKEATRQWRLANPQRSAYLDQRAKAHSRGIDWEFTFDSWIAWWGEDFDKRGRDGTELVMARRGDTGPYSIENVTKITARQNLEDGHLNRSST